MTSVMEFRLLGHFEVLGADSHVVDVGRPQQRSLLAFLLLQRNRVVSVDAIVEALWGDHPPSSARNTVQAYVSRLRRALGDDASIATAGRGYRLEVEPSAVDADSFEWLVKDGVAALHREDATIAESALTMALALWRGPALDGFGEPFAGPAATRLRELRSEAEEARAAAILTLGRHAELIGELERMVADEPYNEHRWALLMTALYRSGRQADALDAYQRARRELGEGLGLEPSPELRNLQAAVLSHSSPLPGPQPAGRSRVAMNLPLRSASFVGRLGDAEEVAGALGRSRLVTLTGPGGCGKTSLAVEVARAEARRFTSGVCFVDLSPLRSGAQVAEALAHVVGVRDRPGRTLTETLAEFLGHENALVVLDNCEHLLESCSELVRVMLGAGPNVHVLATSRERLGLPGELVWLVPPLAEADSAALFNERAEATQPGFVSRSPLANQAVARLCARLEGMPLAIELAAAQVSALSVNQIIARLDDAFSLLRRPGHGGEPRHQTLRAALEWSYDLLSKPERILFERLSVFPGSFTLEAAEAVAMCDQIATQDVVGYFTRLVNRCLVLRTDVEEAAEPRYRLLETVRQFSASVLRAGDQSAENDARAAHARHYLARAEEIEPHLVRRGARPWFDRAAADHHNFRAAIEWSISAGGAWLESAGQILDSLAWAWFLDGRIVEPRMWATSVLEQTTGRRTLGRALTLHAASLLASAQSDISAVVSLAAEQLELAIELDCTHLRAAALDVLGIGLWARGELDASLDAHREAVALFASCGNHAWEAMCTSELGRTLADAGRIEEAQQAHQRATALARAVGENSALGFALDASAQLALQRGKIDEAAALIIEAIEHYRASGYQEGLASGLNARGMIGVAQGDWPAAAASFAEALGLCRQIGHLGGAATALAGLGETSSAVGDWAAAARRSGAAANLRRRAGVTLTPKEQADFDAFLERVRGQAGEAAFITAWTAGEHSSVDQTEGL